MRIITTLLVTLVILLTSALTYANTEKKVLIVLTSHSELGNTGLKTGFWLPELTHPYYTFKEAGYTIDIASIQGGMAPLDALAFNEPDPYHQTFLEDAQLMAKVMRTVPLSTIKSKDYQVVLFSGGSGPMWDFPDNKDVQRVSREIYENDGIVSALCHGNAALINIKLSNGEYLIAGKDLAAFTNEEEASLKQTDIVPYSLQDTLVKRGAKHIYGKAWQENVVVDDRLFTGQNPASAHKMSQEIIKHLEQ